VDPKSKAGNTENSALLGAQLQKKSRPAFENETRPLRLHTDGLRRSLINQSEIQSMTCTGPREQRASGQNLAATSTRTAPNEPNTCVKKEHWNRERIKTKFEIQILKKSEAKRVEVQPRNSENAS
jgi:hypothetical protein